MPTNEHYLSPLIPWIITGFSAGASVPKSSTLVRRFQTVILEPNKDDNSVESGTNPLPRPRIAIIGLVSSSGKQQTVQLPSLATLKGTSFDVRHLDSVSVILVDQPSLRGLYRLTFANGDAYVGQAINVANRFTSHRRRWEDITQFEFFPIPEGDLNQPEKDLIHLTEANGNVRNIALAHKPLGENSLEIEVSEGATILLPWDRNKRVRPGDSSVSGFRSSFFERSQIPCYSD